MENSTKPWSSSWLGNCQVVSEELLKQVACIMQFLRLRLKLLDEQ